MSNVHLKISKIIDSLADDELTLMNALSIKELKKRGIVRSRNIVGDIGEYKSIKFFNDTPNEPKLQFAPESTQNIDAISRKGERYSIKTVTYPAKTTGVFYGLNSPEDLKRGILDKQHFEYVLIVVLDDELNLINILEMNWDVFIKNKRWHSRMMAWNLSLTENLKKQCRKVF